MARGRFGGGWRSVAVEGLFRCPCTCPDLGRFFVWGCTTQRLPLGGKLSPKVTDEGAILYPTFPCRKISLSPRRFPPPAPLGESIAPSSAPVCALGHLPPEGKALGVGRTLLVCKTTPPSPPSRWAGRYGRGTHGPQARQKRRSPPAGSPQPEKVGPGRKNLFLPGVLSSGFLPKKAGPPPGAGRVTTSQVLTCAGPNRTTYRCQRTPAGQACPLGASPAPLSPFGERLSFPRAFWYNRGHQPNLSR